MVYTPNTWTAGDVITKTKMDRLEAAVAALSPRQARAHHLGSQNIPATTTTDVTLTDLTVNEDSAYFTVSLNGATTNPNSIQLLKSGMYRVDGCVAVGNNNDTAIVSGLIRAGATTLREQATTRISGGTTRLTFGRTLRLAANDLLTLKVYYAVAGTVTGAGASETALEVTYLSD